MNSPFLILNFARAPAQQDLLRFQSCWRFPETPRKMLDCPRFQLIVVIQDHEKLTVGMIERILKVPCDAHWAFNPQILDARVVHLSHQLRRLIVRRIVRNKNLQLGIALRKHARKRTFQQFASVVGRNSDRNQIWLENAFAHTLNPFPPIQLNPETVSAVPLHDLGRDTRSKSRKKVHFVLAVLPITQKLQAKYSLLSLLSGN